MRTENFKRGVVLILLVFALIFSMISIAPLAHSGGLIYDPGATTIEVVQGDTFVIRYTLEWNAEESGAYTVTMFWDSYDNEPSENFTFVSASAYFDNNGDNIPDPGVDPILALVTLEWAPSSDYPGSTRYFLTVECPADQKDPRNGRFNVDITLGAYGAGGVPHIATDNHPLPFQFAGIIIIESGFDMPNRDPITVRVLESILGVEVSISPESEIGAPGENVTFTVTVTNTGNVEDNYDLTADDNTNWSLTLPETLTDVVPGENRTVNLSVGIPDNAENSTRDNVTVTVTSRADNTVENSASCTAHAVAAPPPPPPERGVQVLISPENQSGLPEETITFTVTVKNTGEAEDSYDLTVSDNAGWGATLAENLLTIPAGENQTTTVSVTVPSDADENESTRITVTATSIGDPTVENSAWCTAKAEAVPVGPPGPPIPTPVIVGAAIGVGAIAVIVLLLKRGMLHLLFLCLYSRAHRPRFGRQ